MTREVQVMAWCDVDMAEDRRVPMAASHEVVVDGKAYTVDLCEDHEVALYKPFVALVAHGSAPAPKGAQNRAQRAVAASSSTRPPRLDVGAGTPEGFRCLSPECAAPFHGKTQGALSQHMRMAHGLSMADLGTVCPVCGESHTERNAMGGHIGKVHPDAAPPVLSGYLAAWWWASGHGDPHGVIAASGLLPFLVDPEPLAPGATRVQVHTP